MKRFIATTAIGLGAALSLPASAQDVTLRVHHIWPNTATVPSKVLNPWCEKIAAESKNRLKCHLMPSMSAGGTAPQLVDRVKDGVDDMVLTLPGYTPGRFPTTEVFELPFMARDAESASRAVWEFVQKNSLKEFQGTKLLAIWVHDEGHLHNAKRPIKTLADFKGLKLRAPTRQTTKLVQLLGASAVGMPITGVADAISKGTLDGAAIPWEAVTGFRITENVKYHTVTPPTRPALYTAVLMWTMNQAKYDALAPDLKAIIDRHSGAALSAQLGKAYDDSQAPSRKIAEDRKNEVYTLPEAEVDQWIKASAPIYDAWVADMDKRGLNGKQLLQDARELVKKHAKP